MNEVERLLIVWQRELKKLIEMNKTGVSNAEFFRQSNRVSLAHLHLLEAHKRERESARS